MVAWTRLNITLHVHCLSCFNFASTFTCECVVTNFTASVNLLIGTDVKPHHTVRISYRAGTRRPWASGFYPVSEVYSTHLCDWVLLVFSGITRIAFCTAFSGSQNNKIPIYSALSSHYCEGRAMLQAVCRRPLTVKARIKTQAIECVICSGGKKTIVW